MKDRVLHDEVRVALRAAADENLVAAFGLAVRHYGWPPAGIRRFGGVVAVAVGLPAAFYNPVIVVDDAARSADVRKAISWVRGLGVDPSLQVRDDLDARIRPVALASGLVPDAWATPGMALAAIPAVVPASPPELTIRVVDPSTLDNWHAVLGSGPNFRRLLGPGFLADPDAILLTGHVEGKPVTVAAAFRSARAVGIYAVGTVDEARRHGYGRAITWAAISAGRDAWNLDVAILQSTEMGLPVYASMGFVEVCRYATYEAISQATRAGIA